MKLDLAAKRLSALAQEGRLTVFRLLVKAGHEGLAAGEVAKALGIPPNTLSAQLTILASAGLITSKRSGRSIIYSAHFDGMAELLAYLVDDCCNGQLELCAPLVGMVSRAPSCC